MRVSCDHERGKSDQVGASRPKKKKGIQTISKMKLIEDQTTGEKNGRRSKVPHGPKLKGANHHSHLELKLGGAGGVGRHRERHLLNTLGMGGPSAIVGEKKVRNTGGRNSRNEKVPPVKQAKRNLHPRPLKQGKGFPGTKSSWTVGKKSSAQEKKRTCAGGRKGG